MNGARDQFLAGTGFAVDENGGVGRGHDLDRLSEHAWNSAALADHVADVLIGPDLVLQARRDTLPDRINSSSSSKGFVRKFDCTCFDRAHGHWDVAVAREENDGDLNTRFGKLLLQVESV